MKDYVRMHTTTLLRRLAFEVGRAAKSGDAEAIHDLRVAIRRFSRCLQVFAQFYPDNSGKKIRRRLAALMEAAGGVRDLDITLELVADADAPPNRRLVSKLKQRRRLAHRELFDEVGQWNRHGFSKRWRNSLGLSA